MGGGAALPRKRRRGRAGAAGRGGRPVWSSSLRDVLIRDEVISWTAGEEISGVLAVLRELAPLAPPPFDTQVLASLAWAAYSFG